MPGPHRTFDLQELVRQLGSSFDFQIRSPEAADERRSRLRQQEAEGGHERRKDWALFLVGSALISTISLGSLLVVLFSLGTPDTQKSASSLLTIVVSAVAGSMTGKSAGK